MDKDVKVRKPFRTKFDRFPDPTESNHGERLTQQSGYIPAREQIRNMLDAGIKLNNYRNGLYQPLDDDSEIPPVYGDKIEATAHYKRLVKKKQAIEKEQAELKAKNLELLRKSEALAEAKMELELAKNSKEMEQPSV